MNQDFRSQAFELYSEMHDAQMALFNAGWELSQSGQHEEGLRLMRQGNWYNGTETYLLIIGLGNNCRKDYWLSERAESLH